jgi:hypothetical protein
MDMVGRRCPGPNTCAARRARSDDPEGRMVNGRNGCDLSIQYK